jgi:hypothetical protein
MALPLGDLNRLFEIALELKNAGRLEDAELLRRLVNTADGQDDVRIDVSDEELDRALQAADADIAAGRVTPHTEVMERAHDARRAQVTN